MKRPPLRKQLVGFLAVLLTALPSAVCTAHAACSSGTEPFTLCGTTTISGSSSGSLRVKLTSAATLSALTPGGGVSFSGGGRLAGLILQPSASPSNYLYFSRPATSFGGDRFDVTRGYNQDAAGNYSLAAGNYTLYVLTDGSPTTVTLTLGGLSGSSSLSVQRSFPLTVDTVLLNKPMGGTSPSAQGAKAHAVSGANSLLVRYVSVTHPSQFASAAGSCRWDGTPPPEASTQPFCPGADDVQQTNPTLATQPSYWTATLTGPVSTGTHGLGGYAVSASGGGSLSILGVWLTLTG